MGIHEKYEIMNAYVCGWILGIDERHSITL